MRLDGCPLRIRKKAMKDRGVVYGNPKIPEKKLGDPWRSAVEVSAKRIREQRKPRIQRAVERMMVRFNEERMSFEEISIRRICCG
jgi:hypothetical protein